MDTRYLLAIFLLLHAALGLEKTLDIDSSPKSYKEVEKEITGFVNVQLRSLLPKIVSGTDSTTISQKCTAGMMKILANVRRLKGWTLKILDSIGKPTAGILAGTSYSLGHYDQCVHLAVTSRGVETTNASIAMFQGMYCKIKLSFADALVESAKNYHRGQLNSTELGKLKEFIQAAPYVPVTSEYMTHYLGICLPSICNLDDVQQLLKIISFPGSATIERCEIKTEEDLNKTQVTIIIFFIILFCLVCINTLIHWACHERADDKMSNHNKCASIFISFSFFNNTKRLTRNIDEDTDGVLSNHCVRGIVVTSLAWIILGHTYLLPYDAFYMQSSSLENLENYLTKIYFSFIVNFPLAFESLLVCYGFILTYTLWLSVCRTEDIKVNVLQIIACNYLRICIPVLICLGVTMLLPTFGYGPFWKDFMDEEINRCYKNAWAYVGMYSNLLDQEEQCFPHLWFSSCLAQITLIGIILAWILSKNMKYGIATLILLALAGNITVSVYTYGNKLPPTFNAYFAERSSNFFWKLNHSLPFSHFASYAIGMLTGIFVARRSSHKLRPCIAIVGWLLCLCILEGIFLFIYYHHMENMGSFWSTMYAGCHRILFAICVSWVIVSCSLGNGSFINSILSWRIFDPLFHLSYYAYIFHIIIIAFTVGVAREHFYYSHQELILRAISHIVVTYLVSYLFYMMLEMPLKSLCWSLSSRRTSQIEVTPLNNIKLNRTDFPTQNNTISGACKLWSVSMPNSKISTVY